MCVDTWKLPTAKLLSEWGLIFKSLNSIDNNTYLLFVELVHL